MNKTIKKWEVRFENALTRTDLSEAIRIFEERNKSSGTPRGFDKVKALNIIQRLAKNSDESYIWAIQLMDNDSAAARDLGALLAATFIVPLYTHRPQEAKEIILRIAEDNHWEVRESTDNVLLPIVKADFTKTYELLKRWATHPSENVRRAVVMTVKKAGKERHSEWAYPLLDLLELLLNDRSVYVRKNLGPFAIGDGFLRYYPEITLQRLAEWAKEEDEQVRWNVAMVFSAAEAAKYVDAALPILELLALDQRRYVWRAVASAMRNLGRRVPEKIVPVLEKWLKDEKRIRPAQTVLMYI